MKESILQFEKRDKQEIKEEWETLERENKSMEIKMEIIDNDRLRKS